uniref:Uncharacterized protein n=1 Tax=Rhizophora mucronata TaxID=61149 RepID=A0A2P2K5A9_RHIMU
MFFHRRAAESTACPSTNGKLEFPCLQFFKLKVPRNSKAPPNSVVLSVAIFLENIKPTKPPVIIKPPLGKNVSREWIDDCDLMKRSKKPERL